MKKFKIKSFCKVNLSLKVLKRLRNGYHNIKSLITFCNLYDLITVSKSKYANDKIIFYGEFSKGINKKLNTITQVLNLLRKNNFLNKQKFIIKIKKNIPHGSGLGGGSSNAASLLQFLKNKMYLKISRSQVISIANQIGFDVPIFLEKKNTFLNGKKNKILRINKKFRLNILIIYPNIICSTKKIYLKNRKFTHSKNQNYLTIKNKTHLFNYLKKENNDLQHTVIKLYPNIKKVINFVAIQNGCYFSRITGSGSACIGIFSNAKMAIYAQKMIKLKFPKYWCAVSKSI